MKISDIDVNFKAKSVNEPDIEWFDANDLPFSVHGVYYSQKDGKFLRIPEELGKSISHNMYYLASNTAGGRLRFATNSPYVAIKAEVPYAELLPHMPMTGVFGFSLYEKKHFVGKFTPTQTDYEDSKKNLIHFDGISRFAENGMHECTLYFPLYNGVNKLYIGLQKGCVLKEATPYKYSTPVMFYGSSITQGGCASRPGNDYVSMISRWLDTDVINLGFSGNGKAEPIILDYMAAQDVSVFVMDYDYNAPDPEYLRKTHLNAYIKLRAAKKNVPIVFISKPDFEYDSTSAERRSIIKETYNIAKQNGDSKVYFIDGEKLFGKKHRDLCTVDTCHPNDYGFYKMAEKISPVIKKILKAPGTEK